MLLRLYVNKKRYSHNQAPVFVGSEIWISGVGSGSWERRTWIAEGL